MLIFFRGLQTYAILFFFMFKPLLDERTISLQPHQLGRLDLEKFECLYVVEIENYLRHKICKIGTSHNFVVRLRNIHKQIRKSGIAQIGAIAVIPILHNFDRDADQFYLRETKLSGFRMRSCDVERDFGKFTGYKECLSLNLAQTIAIIRGFDPKVKPDLWSIAIQRSQTFRA